MVFCRGFGKTSLQEVSLEGVSQAYGAHSESAQSKGVKAHFRMDESGILSMESAEFVFETEKEEEESTLSSECRLHVTPSSKFKILIL